jgi:hypothetical protein
VALNIWKNTIVILPARERKVTPRYVPEVKLGNLEVGEKVKARWVGGDYKGDHYYEWVILNDGCHVVNRPRQPLQRPLAWQHDAMVKSFFAPQTELNQMDSQCLMFSWKKTELENIFGDEIEETTTPTVSLHNSLWSRCQHQRHARQGIV